MILYSICYSVFLRSKEMSKTHIPWKSGTIAEKMLKNIFSTLIPSPAILHTFSCIYRSGQLAVFLELWIYVSSQIHGTLVSRTIYARSVGLHFFLLYQGSQCHSAAFCQSQSENIDTHNIWCILVVQPFSQSKIFFEDGLQPTVFVGTFKNERLC